VKLVRAIRKGWIKTGKAKRAEQQQPQVYLLWGDDDQVSTKKECDDGYMTASSSSLRCTCCGVMVTR
jgi:hypothetical protein